uniref:Uncharacterized protein n=1 Tax=Romanomermis culicivorax TaxID=13658 RepID=A0A915J812_ROMCU
MDRKIDRIWDTKERIKKRSGILEKKLEQARRVLHLPGSEYYPLDRPSSGEDCKIPFHLRTNTFRYTNMSSAQIRFAHDA